MKTTLRNAADAGVTKVERTTTTSRRSEKEEERRRTLTHWSRRNAQKMCRLRVRGSSALRAFALQLGQGFLIHVPFLQNGEDSPGPEPSPSQLPENARRLFLIFRFHQPLLPEILTRLPLFAHPFKSRVHSLVDHVAVHPLRLQIGDDAQPAKLLVVPPQRGKIRGVLRIVQISAIFQSSDDQLHQRLPVLRVSLHAHPQQTFQFRHRSHAPRQRPYGIFVQLILGIEPSLGTWERHPLTINPIESGREKYQ